MTTNDNGDFSVVIDTSHNASAPSVRSARKTKNRWFALGLIAAYVAFVALARSAGNLLGSNWGAAAGLVATAVFVYVLVSKSQSGTR